MSKDKIYKHLKANVDKYENIFEDLINEEKNRIKNHFLI